MPHMEVGAVFEQGDLSTIGSGLDLFGVSTLNPNQFLNNCVSVTITKILAYSNVHAFWQDTLQGDLPDEPLSLDQTKQLLRKTGWGFEWRVYRPCNGKSAYYNLQSEFNAGAESSPFRGVAYTRDGRDWTLRGIGSSKRNPSSAAI
ncbi:hypothetical protein VTL71DRAFT_927 [Oculimacula yallundae]|uniref:Uncharacterized protein n=1 Tax=Oculimacula yallundae TaxID=86028 RepID=A0ABR4D1E9_9HELO